MDELIDIYDGERNRTGEVAPRYGKQLGKGQYMLYALAMVESTRGGFLITQRALDKGWGAGWWEMPGGGVLTGETTLQTVLREVGEETGLTPPRDGAIAPVYTYRNDDPEGGDNYFCDIYHFTFDFGVEDVDLQQSEAIDCRLVSWDEITQLAERGTFLHYDRYRRALVAEGVLEGGQGAD